MTVATMGWKALARALALALASLAPAIGGCDLLGPEGLEELQESRRLWQSQGVTDYVYVLRRGCFCTPEAIGPVQITVRGGTVVSRTYVEGGDPVTQWLDSWPSIDGLFDLLQRAIDGEADKVDVAYHPQMGYPVSADIDYIEQAIDDELRLTVTSFHPFR